MPMNFNPYPMMPMMSPYPMFLGDNEMRNDRRRHRLHTEGYDKDYDLDRSATSRSQITSSKKP